MSIYATLWRLKFPGGGDDYVGCEWVEIIAQGVPAHIGASDPEAPDDGTDRSGQEYVDPLLVLSGREYRTMPFEDLYNKLCDALRGDRPRLVAQSWGPDGRVRLLFEDGGVEEPEPKAT